MKFTKKPITIEATQWFKNGDHPKDDCTPITALGENPDKQGEAFLSEGKVVRRYRLPTMDGQDTCIHCKNIMHIHGWIDTLEGGHTVCPSDWIITGIEGEMYPCKDSIFKATYSEDNTEDYVPIKQDWYDMLLGGVITSVHWEKDTISHFSVTNGHIITEVKVVGTLGVVTSRLEAHYSKLLKSASAVK